ncbi:MAG: TolC family protein, partial [Phycisphaerae bacterium]
GTDVILGPTFGIELPLWDQNQAQIAKSDRMLEQLLHVRDAALVNATQDIHTRVARMETAAENARFYESLQLPAARRNIDLTREAYASGKLTFLTVLEAERKYLATRSDFLLAMETFALAMVELERATGCPAASWESQGEVDNSTEGAGASRAMEDVDVD